MGRDKSVQEYYHGFLTLWHENDTMVLDTISTALRPGALKLQMESHIKQFLMHLRLEFESVWAALMNREIFPDLDTCVQVVIREELRFQFQNFVVEEPRAFSASFSN